MSTVTQNTFTKEEHPWNCHIPSGATKLFIGTFPTAKRNRKHEFFYSSSTNRFWEIVASLIGKTINDLSGTNAIVERQNALQKLKLGLTDMGKEIIRQQGSSKDHSLFPVEFMDIIQLLKDHSTIVTLIVTGSTQGNSSLSWFNIFCELNNVEIDTKELEKQLSTEVTLADRKINVLMAHSPSRLSRVKTDTLLKEYESIILDK